MSTTVQYKGNTLTTVSNDTKTLKTAGKYMEGDVVLTDESVDVSQDTVTPETLLQGYTAHNNTGALITGSATGGYVYQDAEGFVVLDDEGVGSTIDLEERIVSISPETQIITVDSVVEKPTWVFPVQDRSSNSYTYYDSKNIINTNLNGEYIVVGKIDIINSNDEILESYDINVLCNISNKYNTAQRISIDSVEDPYISGFKLVYNVNNKKCQLYIFFNKTANYGINTSFSIYNKSGRYEGINSITINPGYDAELMRSFISRRSSFTEFTLPSNIDEIGAYAFANCQYLEKIDLPDTIKYIRNSAFYNCYNLILTSLPPNILQIESKAFQYCRNITLTSLPDNLTTITSYCFFGNTKIALTSLPNKIKYIEDYAFYQCASLAISTIPSTTTSIGSYAFSGCIGIQTIYSEAAITNLGGYSFNGNSSYPMALKSASFPNMKLGSLLSTVFGSTSEANACKELEYLDIGLTTGIAATAFANCHKLQTLILRKTTVASLANVSAFTNTPMQGYNDLSGVVYVPNDLIESYKTATNWKTLYDAGTIEFKAIEGSEYEIEE